ncbi:MAG: patatin-like phospholipase family protein, partial [Bryobacteraceae bacterium]
PLLPRSWRKPTGVPLHQRFPLLTRRDNIPRVVFLASGGVFRGSFHIGMLGAMVAANIRPDVIVGASVGTLMGATLGAMFTHPEKQAGALELLGEITGIFVAVDQRIALTKKLKAASKDLSLRMSLVDLSPDKLRRMVRGGGRGGPGLVMTGAPPALIEAIADLFLLGYRDTANVAAWFVEGEVAKAARDFWKQVEGKTIERLGIHDSLIGASLLEAEVRRLLGSVAIDRAQPFLDSNQEGTAFFATTVNLVEEWLTILGTDLEAQERSYDFVNAALASSAFPAAFPPRRQSEIFPGFGRRDIFYGDGGTYDNLPFFPAVLLLRQIQADYLKDNPDAAADHLRARVDSPDLFLVGALDIDIKGNPTAKTGDPVRYESLLEITRRAGELASNEKIYGFQLASRKVGRMLAKILTARPGGGSSALLDGTVYSEIVPVYPADRSHLNGTFQFCAATGLRRDRVQRSIADGCFQTLHTLAVAQRSGAASPHVAARRLPLIQIERKTARSEGQCPFFLTSAQPKRHFGERRPPAAQPATFACPFQKCGQSEIFKICAGDKVHRKAVP